MGLSAEEQAELEMHESSAKGGGLSPEEQAELESLQAAPAAAPSMGTRALQLLSKGTKARDMLMAAMAANHAPTRALWGLAAGKPPARDFINAQDAKNFATTPEGGLDASDILARAGAGPGVSKWGGLAADVAVPNPMDPVGAALGKGISMASKPFRAAGLRGALSRVPWRQKPAVLDSLIEEGVAGTAKNQAAQIGAGVEKYDNAVSAAAQSGADAGHTFDGAGFNAEASSLLDNMGRLHPTSELGAAQGYASKIAQEQAATRSQDVSLPFANNLRKAIGSTGDPALQQIRQMLRARLISNAGETAGPQIEQGLTKESQMLRARPGAEAMANRSMQQQLLAPAIGAMYGAGRRFDPTDLDLGAIGKGALYGAGIGAAITSPAFLSRGAQGFQAASPWLGALGAQELYRSTKNPTEDPK